MRALISVTGGSPVRLASINCSRVSFRSAGLRTSLSTNHLIIALFSGLALAFSTYDSVVRLVWVTGYTASTCTGGCSRLSRAAMAVANARLPPALSPASANRLGSPLIDAALASTHLYEASASSQAAGNLCSGASR